MEWNDIIYSIIQSESTIFAKSMVLLLRSVLICIPTVHIAGNRQER